MNRWVMVALCGWLGLSLTAASPRPLEAEIQELRNWESKLATMRELDTTQVRRLLAEEIDRQKKRLAELKGFAHVPPFVVYASRSEDARDYGRLARETYNRFRQFFPDTQLQFENPVLVIVYPTARSYSIHEGTPPAIRGHAISGRKRELGLRRENGQMRFGPGPMQAAKQHRLVTYEQRGEGEGDVFVHEIAHVLVWDMLNPDRFRPTDLQGHWFFNEGLAEFFAYQHSDWRRASRVLQASNQVRWDFLDFSRRYPVNEDDIGPYYAEATMMVAWMMAMERGNELVRAALKTTNRKEALEVLRNHLRSIRAAESDPVRAYEAARAQDLKDAQKRLSSPGQGQAPGSQPARPPQKSQDPIDLMDMYL